MDKYRKVMKPKEEIQKADEEIRVTAAGSVSAYVSRAATVFNELKKPYVIVQATGNALTKAVTAAEVIKRRFKGLHQITELKTVDITDEYEPLEEGLDKVTDIRSVSVGEPVPAKAVERARAVAGDEGKERAAARAERASPRAKAPAKAG
eukprot:g29494.t1